MAGTGLSAAGAYFSYKALQQDPVQVTTLARECVSEPRYIRISCDERRHLSDGVLDLIAEHNASMVTLCGIARPAPLQC